MAGGIHRSQRIHMRVSMCIYKYMYTHTLWRFVCLAR